MAYERRARIFAVLPVLIESLHNLLAAKVDPTANYGAVSSIETARKRGLTLSAGREP